MWPGNTAKGTALLKLVHQFQRRVILRDDYLQWFFDGAEAAALRDAPPDFDREPRTSQEEWERTAYWYAVLRELAFDEVIVDAVGEGCRELLLLGAGYDTRFFRLPQIAEADIAVVEVDRSTTIAEKRARLEARLGSLPPRLSLIALDFNDEPLTTLFDLGLDRSSPTICVWQGVSYYLPRESVAAVLDFVKRELPQGTRLAFDAACPLMLVPNDRIPGIACNLERLARIGEPFRFGMAPAEMTSWLEAMGFREVRVAEQAQLEERYLRRRTLPSEMWYLVTART